MCIRDRTQVGQAQCKNVSHRSTYLQHHVTMGTSTHVGLASQLQPHRTATLHSLHIPPYTADTQPAQRPVASFWLWVTEHTHMLLLRRLLPPHRPTLSAACVMDGARWAGAAGQHSRPTAHEHIAPHHHTIQHTCLSSAHAWHRLMLCCPNRHRHKSAWPNARMCHTVGHTVSTM